MVDDFLDAADAVARYLATFGHEVHVAYDGEAALETARRMRPDVVLLDVGKPKLDGYEVCRALRRDLGHDVVLVAVTGRGQPSDRKRAQAAGFDHHLVKPVDLAELLKLLR